ncbi:MAG: GntR family transcriptional regulator [Actinomycetota bacterium]
MIGGVRVHLDLGSGVPASEQVRTGIARAIRRGRLLPGERLPTVRELAAELRLAANTVAKAYRKLEADGLVVGRGRHGTYVADVLPVSPDEARTRLVEAARTYARRARQLGVDGKTALQAVRRALERD